MDDRILKESELRDKREAIIDDRKSEKSGRGGSLRPGTTGSKHGGGGGARLDIDTKSVASSRMSGASHLSKTSKAKDAPN